MLTRRRLHNRIAESVLTLPVCAVVALVLTLSARSAAPEVGGEVVVRVSSLHIEGLWGRVVTVLLLYLTAYVMMETNNANQLIRVRTRLMASFYLLLGSVLPWRDADVEAMTVAFCTSVAYYLLFRCYQLAEAPGIFFHVTLFWALGSLCQPLVAVMVVPCYVYMMSFMRSMSLRTFCGGLLGVVFPYLLWAIWCFLHDDFVPLSTQVDQFADWPSPSLSRLGQLPLAERLTLGVLAFYALVGIVHYWRTNYSDKIRARMMLYVYVCQTLLLFLLLLTRPDCFVVLSALFVVAITPLLSHYFALTRTRLSLLLFFLAIVSYLALIYVNRWMQ